MSKRGEYSMISGFGAVGPILLCVVVLVLLAFWGYRVFSSQVKRSYQKNQEKKIQRPTKKDRELLELIGDLAELYRTTGC